MIGVSCFGLGLVCLVLVQGIILNDNVAFQKINTVTTTRAQWTVTFVVDLSNYTQLLDKINDNLLRISNYSRHAVKQCCLRHEDKYGSAFERLSHRVGLLMQAYEKLAKEFHEYHTLSRDKRSILPFVGDALHYLFGTAVD